MQDLICQAIREKRLLELHYGGHARKVAPHIYGIDAAGDELLTCYEVWGGADGAPAGWRSLRLADVTEMSSLAKILWLSASDLHQLWAEVYVVLDDGEGDAGELASQDNQCSGSGQAAGAVTLIEGSPERGPAS
jgi:hypothetical protein